MYLRKHYLGFFEKVNNCMRNGFVSKNCRNELKRRYLIVYAPSNKFLCLFFGTRMKTFPLCNRLQVVIRQRRIDGKFELFIHES